MLAFREKVTLEQEMAALVDELLLHLRLPPSFTLREFCQAVADSLGTDLHTYRTLMPSEIGGLGLASRDGRTIILVNRRHTLLAEDYTILHELGHLILGHLVPNREAQPYDEWRADLFARVVLDRMIYRRPRRPTVLTRLRQFFSA